MTPTRLRDQLHEDHTRLRGKVQIVRSLAMAVIRGDRDLGPALRLKGLDLQECLLRHMRWEEREMLPALYRAGQLGVEAGETMREEHRSQRSQLSESLMFTGGCDGLEEAMSIAHHLLELASWLERDMGEEEQRIIAALNFHAPGVAPRSPAQGADGV